MSPVARFRGQNFYLFLFQMFLLHIILITCLAVESTAMARNHTLPYNVLLVLPSRVSRNNPFGLTILEARPVIDIAVYDAMPIDWINITYHDSMDWKETRLVERWAMNGVVAAYCAHRLDAILGITDNYALATVAKITAGWGAGVPVITTTGMVSQLNSRLGYPYLVRMQGSYRQIARSIYRFIAYRHDDDHRNASPAMKSLGYKNLVFMYHDKRRAVNRQTPPTSGVDEFGDEEMSSHCYFMLYAVKTYFIDHNKYFNEVWKLATPAVAFDEDLQPRKQGEVAEWLRIASNLANGK